MEMWLDHTEPDERGIHRKRARAENPKASIIIKANNKSTVEPVARVVDSAREAGIYNISLSTGD
jgi:biopolymer transport protein ExbD